MKLFTTYLTLAFLTVFSAANAQEHWEMYMTKVVDKPGSMLVDMGLASKAPDSHLPFLVITGPQSLDCKADGLPQEDEISRLEEILSATDNFLTGVTAKTLAGTFTSDCKRMNYYYVKDTMGVRAAIQRMYKRNFPAYKYVLKIKEDKDWKTYRTFLYPSDDDIKWIEEQRAKKVK